MFRHYFYYWLTFILLLNLAPLLNAVEIEIQQQIAVSFALVLGIPHGAVDHILFAENTQISTKRFILFYILAIGLNVVLWFLFPSVSLIGFLLLSAYHFGQSQFSAELKKSHALNVFLYLSWGITVLSAFMYFNADELLVTAKNVQDLSFFTPILTFLAEPYLLLFGLFSTCIQLLLYSALKLIAVEKLVMEAILLGSIFLIAEIFTFLIGFSLFFVGVHSLKMIIYEWEHFKLLSRSMTLKRFGSQLIPLTLVSFAGIAFLVLVIHLDLIGISIPLAILIVISSVTVPHSFVMEYFFSSKRNNA